MMRWGENETYQFVKIYLSHNYLWNSEHECYKLKDKRQKAYQAIINEFMSCTGIKLNESEVKIKIKNLRSTYTQEITKIRTRSSPNSPYRPTIKWFADWHKCFKNNSRKSVIDSIDDEQILTDESNNKTWISDNSEQVNDERNIDPFASQTEEDDDLDLKYEPNIIQSNRKAQSTYKMNRKKNKTRSPSSDQSDGIFKSSSTTNSSVESMTREDEFDIYGRYIASQLRKMDLQKALRLQLEIQSLVSEARIADISSLH